MPVVDESLGQDWSSRNVSLNIIEQPDESRRETEQDDYHRVAPRENLPTKIEGEQWRCHRDQEKRC